MLELNRIYNEDCIGGRGMCLIPDKSVDMILCDLPYGTTACAWDSIIPFEPLWEQYKRVIKDDGAIVLTSAQPFTSVLITSNIEMFRYCWIWEKPQGVDPFMVSKRPLSNYEDVCVFSKKSPVYNPQMESGDLYKVTRDRHGRDYKITGTQMKETTTINLGERYPKRILRFNQERGEHPTQKPVALFEYLIKTYTNEGDTVLDNCMGSGTTAVAAIATRRNFIGFELDKEYHRIANERIGAVQLSLIV